MATGYENRQPTRASFVIQPKAPVQTQRSAPGATGRVGQVGGENTRGGVIQSQNPSINAGIGANIPGFLDKVFEPMMQAKQMERMYQGYADAVDGRTMQEIQAEQPWLSGLFGQTDFERGASFFHAKDAVAQWTAAQTSPEGMDQLKRLDPSQVGKYLYEAADTFMTGDENTDNAIRAAVIENAETMLPQVTRARIAWRQGELRARGTSLGVSASGVYMSAYESAVADPATADPEAINAARRNLFQAFAPVPGQTAEDSAAVVTGTLNALMADKQGASVAAIMEGGTRSIAYAALAPLGEEGMNTYRELVGRYENMGKDIRSDLMLTDPQARRMRLEIDALQAFDGLQNTDALIAKELELSNYMQVKSGVPKVGISGDDLISSANETTSGLAAQHQRVQNAEREEALQQARIAADIANNPNSPANIAAAAAQKAADIRNMLLDGDITFATHSQADIDTYMVAQYRSNPTAAVAQVSRLYRNTGVVLEGTARDMQARIRQTISAGVDSAGFREAYQGWVLFGSDGIINGEETEDGVAARARYYGEDDARMREYHIATTRHGATPLAAFDQAFNRTGAIAGRPTPRDIPRGADVDAMRVAARNGGRNWIARTVGSRDNYATSSLGTIEEWVVPEALYLKAQSPNLTPDQAVARAEQALLGNGTLDRVGGYVFPNAGRNDNMASLTGLTRDQLTPAVQSIIDNFHAGDRVFGAIPKENLELVRVDGEGAATRWAVVGEDPNTGQDVYRVFNADLVKFHNRAIAERTRTQAENRNTNRALAGYNPNATYADSVYRDQPAWLARRIEAVDATVAEREAYANGTRGLPLARRNAARQAQEARAEAARLRAIR